MSKSLSIRRLPHAARCFFFLSLLVFLIAAGCQPPQDKTGNVSAEELVRKSVEKRMDLQNLAGSGEMKIVDKGSDFSLSVKIEMVAKDPDHLRIRATKLADAIVAFDLLMQGRDVAFYVPTRNTLYTGNVENLQSGGVNFSPKAVINRILHADRGLLDRKWKILGTNKDMFSANLVLEQIHTRGQPYVKIYVDGRREVLLKVEHFNEKGIIFFLEEYNGYKEMMTDKETLSGRKIGAGVFFPTRFLLSWPDKGRYVSVTLRNFEVDKQEKEIAEFWTIDDLDMDTVKKKNLAQVNVEGDKEAQQAARQAIDEYNREKAANAKNAPAPAPAPVRTAPTRPSGNSRAPSTTSSRSTSGSAAGSSGSLKMPDFQ